MWNHTLDQARRLRAQLIVRQIKNLQAEVRIILWDEREVSQTFDGDAAIGEEKLLKQRWRL